MSRSALIRVVGLWIAISAVVIIAAMFMGAMISGTGLTGKVAATSFGLGLLAALVIGLISVVLMRSLLHIGLIESGIAQKLSDELSRAQDGDLARPWDDLTLVVNGEEKRIPLQEVYERLVGVMVEADRMSGQLNRLAREIMDQAVKLTQGAEDQSLSVRDSTASMGRIDVSSREVVANVEELAGLGENVSASTYEMIANIEEVNRTVQTLNQSVSEVVAAIGEMAGNIHSVAEAAGSLSGSAVQTRKSMEEIDRATRSIRDRADAAAGLSEAAREGAAQTKDLLAQTVQGVRNLAVTIESTHQVMHQLGIQSRSIGEILTVISSVAADTHLLSLNASIMAAKAGEHGRGFAVVAQEIKTLAQRTAESAKEIENLILETQESVDKAIRAIEEGTTRVTESTRLSEKADHSLAEVLQKAEVAAVNAHEIAKDTDGQAAMSEQVFKAVDEVAKRTELIRTAMREQEDSSLFVRERSVRAQDMMASVAQAMSEQAESSRRIATAMDRLTSRIQGIRGATEDQAKSSAGIVRATDVIRKKADLVAISAQNVSNTSMSVLHQSILLHHELKGIKLPDWQARITIGVAMDNLREERWRREKALFESRAKELGVNIEIRVAEGNADKQMTHGEELIRMQVDLLIIVAVDAEVAGRVATKAKKAGIPVLAYDRLIKNSELDLFVSFDAIRIGEVQAETFLLKTKGPRVLLLEGSPTDVNAHMLHQGQLKVLKSKFDKGEVTLVEEIWVPDWEPEDAYRLTKRVLETKGPLDGVIAGNDGCAGGAIRALRELAPGRPVVVTGMDTELSACRRILEGAQTMTMYMPIKLQATRAMEAALLLLRGEDIPGITDYVDNGSMRVPSILLRPVKVDAENLEEVVVKDGFHKREDLFRKGPS